MSTPDRQEALDRIAEAGRSLSDAAVLFHGALADQLGPTGSHFGAHRTSSALTAGLFRSWRPGIGKPSCWFMDRGDPIDHQVLPPTPSARAPTTSSPSRMSHQRRPERSDPG